MPLLLDSPIAPLKRHYWWRAQAAMYVVRPNDRTQQRLGQLRRELLQAELPSLASAISVQPLCVSALHLQLDLSEAVGHVLKGQNGGCTLAECVGANIAQCRSPLCIRNAAKRLYHAFAASFKAFRDLRPCDIGCAMVADP